MMVSTSQRSVDAAFTARPAFRDYGSYGPYSGIDSICQWLLRWHLSQIFLGQVPPRASRPSSSTRAGSYRRAKVRRRPQRSNSAPLPPSLPTTTC